MKKAILIIGIIFTLNLIILAAAGDLDPTFDSDGVVFTAVSSGNDEANSMVIDSAGRIVVAGYSDNGSDNDFAVVRYNTDGSLDTSFDSDGIVTTDFNSNQDLANSVAIDSQGRIVVAGLSNNQFAIVRYNADGSLDTTFDSDGKVRTSVGSNTSKGNSVAIDVNDKIIVAGEVLNSGERDFAVVRYNTDGSLDTGFDTDGIVFTDINSNSNDEGYAVAIDSAGKIVVSGRTFITGSNTDIAIVRYNSDGSLDTSFDTDGIVITDFNGTGTFEQANDVVIDANNKIVVGGGVNNAGSNFMLARYNTDGSLDTSFDTDGFQTVDFGGPDSGRSIAIDSNGRIIVGGNTNDAFGIARLNTDGSLDTNFGTMGKFSMYFGTDESPANAVAVDAYDRIVAAGSAFPVGNQDFAVARLLSSNLIVNKTADTNDGSCDPSDCSLREAIAAANAAATNDTITFDPSLAGQTITLTMGQLVITNNGSLAILGLGAQQLTVSGNNASRVFFILGGNVQINDVTVSDGDAGDSSGGGISNFGTLILNNTIFSGNTAAFGGGISNDGTMTINNSLVQGNSASSVGGGIVNQNDTLFVNNSTVSGNTAQGGGGIETFGIVGSATLTNSTVSGNTATITGGGISNSDSAILTLNSSTISNNSAQFGGGINNFQSTMTLKNTIIANSTGEDCRNASSTVNAEFSLIEEGLTCVNGTNSNNLTGDPGLASLGNYGGPTPTHALGAGSIAIDAGNSDLTTDQRGSPRPVDLPGTTNGPGNFADIGAYEMQITTAAAVTVSGRVLNGKGIGVSGAIVLMTEQSGNIRQVRTNMLGYYRLTDVEIGQTLIFNVYHKNYQFNPQVVSITDTISNLNFTSQ
ncbi:MAG: delta-60 repeat domain-containing protein [Pyrinomonadaceae bacterium]